MEVKGVTKASTVCEVQDWLKGRNLTAMQRGEFDQFDGKDLLALQKNDLKEVLGGLKGVAIYNQIHEDATQAPTKKSPGSETTSPTAEIPVRTNPTPEVTPQKRRRVHGSPHDAAPYDRWPSPQRRGSPRAAAAPAAYSPLYDEFSPRAEARSSPRDPYQATHHGTHQDTYRPAQFDPPEQLSTTVTDYQHAVEPAGPRAGERDERDSPRSHTGNPTYEQIVEYKKSVSGGVGVPQTPHHSGGSVSTRSRRRPATPSDDEYEFSRPSSAGLGAAASSTSSLSSSEARCLGGRSLKCLPQEQPPRIPIPPAALACHNRVPEPQVPRWVASAHMRNQTNTSGNAGSVAGKKNRVGGEVKRPYRNLDVQALRFRLRKNSPTPTPTTGSGRWGCPSLLTTAPPATLSRTRAMPDPGSRADMRARQRNTAPRSQRSPDHHHHARRSTERLDGDSDEDEARFSHRRDPSSSFLDSDALDGRQAPLFEGELNG